MRMLHTMLRVKNLSESLAFYQNALGMKLLRQQEYPDGQFTLAFVGYQDERKEAALELTYNWEQHAYDLGNAYGHIAIEVSDVAETCNNVKKFGYRITREAGPMKYGTEIIAFIQDPDGYKIELIQRGTQF
ncbi:lactoylglutathione lyase [Pseudomonas chlororaphis]|uniref:lactoylglutathione lyase n=1 Tax=Pseudomonas chlororaphis TaxID=587753 RepID=A0A1Q8EMB0_9PSED|nr:lactoylglutathione lyase [Pseudomonas chlororaphis]OLF52934.1 lactoylglutathione lyase [Pseudomonas chlororaphis]